MKLGYKLEMTLAFSVTSGKAPAFGDSVPGALQQVTLPTHHNHPAKETGLVLRPRATRNGLNICLKAKTAFGEQE